MEGVDAAILMHPRVWEASGHVAGFTDPLVECRVCKKRFREDALETSECGKKPSLAAGTHVECDLLPARLFNLMFKTFMGPVETESSVVYLRPETAQGSYVNFLNVQTAARQKVPFGIAQIGKAFRNEITPGNFIFRTPGVRAGRDAVLRGTRDGRGVVRAVAGGAPDVAPFARRSPREPPPPRARAGRAGALCQEGSGHPVPLPVRVEGAGGRPQPHRLRPGPARGVLGKAARVRGLGWREAVRALRGGDGRWGWIARSS